MPCPPAPPPSSTSARRPSGSRATCPAPTTSPRATSSSRSRASRPIATSRVDPVLRRRRALAVRRPDPRRRWATRTSPRCPAGFQGWKSAGLEFDTPVVLDREQKQRYSRHLLIPEVGSAGQAKLLGSQGAAHRRRRARLARPRCTSPRRASARSASSTSTSSTCQQPPAPDRPHDRPGRRAQGRVARRRRSTRSTPTSRSSPTRRCSSPANVERIIAGYDVILDGTDTFETRYILNDAAVAAGIPVIHASVFRFEGQLTTFVPYEGPCYRCLYPTPPPPELAPGCSVAGVLGVVPGILGPAPGERGAQGPARDRRHAGRPAAPVRCPRDRVHRTQAPPRSRPARSAPMRPSRPARPVGRSRRPRSGADAPFLLTTTGLGRHGRRREARA